MFIPRSTVQEKQVIVQLYPFDTFPPIKECTKIGKALLLHFTKSALYTPTLPHEFHKKHA